MGKRKKSSRKPMGPKKRDPLATTFKCPFCSQENSVSVTIDRKNLIGTVDCRECGQHYEAPQSMKALAQPVDVYYEWIDACEALAKDQVEGEAADAPANPRAFASQPKSRAGLAPGEKYTDEDRGFIDDADDMDAEAEYDEE